MKVTSRPRLASNQTSIRLAEADKREVGNDSRSLPFFPYILCFAEDAVGQNGANESNKEKEPAFRQALIN